LAEPTGPIPLRELQNQAMRPAGKQKTPPQPELDGVSLGFGDFWL
jgi:hypothetical protein